jgi:hypothetical protein
MKNNTIRIKTKMKILTNAKLSRIRGGADEDGSVHVVPIGRKYNGAGLLFAGIE